MTNACCLCWHENPLVRKQKLLFSAWDKKVERSLFRFTRPLTDKVLFTIVFSNFSYNTPKIRGNVSNCNEHKVAVCVGVCNPHKATECMPFCKNLCTLEYTTHKFSATFLLTWKISVKSLNFY